MNNIDRVKEICQSIENLADCGTYDKGYIKSIASELILLFLELLNSSDCKENEWMDISTPPLKDGSYLVCTKNKSVCTARFYTSANKFSSRLNDSIVAWMPLPKPLSTIDNRKEYR